MMERVRKAIRWGGGWALALAIAISVARVAEAEPESAPRIESGADVLNELAVAFERLAAGGAAAKATTSAEDAERQWAFIPPRRSAIPETKSKSWARNEIDSFVLARLEAAGLAPSPVAGRAALIRRVSFDLIGLPPTFEEIEAFKNDPDPAAYEKLVDRLLASPRYGERWAQHWLDVARFAESNGFEMNQPRANAWRYRDWVIRALNEDKPYDRFVMEQLAGDSLGADEATGFIVGGAWDEVKSPDPELTAQQRMDELHDMVSTAGAAFLGLTVGCARCHDHKFDPISQKDYYAVQAVFAGVNHGERELTLPNDEFRIANAEKLKKRLGPIEKFISRHEPLANPDFGVRRLDAAFLRPGLAGRTDEKAASDAEKQSGVEPPQSKEEARQSKKPARPPVHPLLNSDRFAPAEARFVRFTILETNGAEPCLDELEIWTAEESPRNAGLASAGAKATSSGNYPDNTKHKLEHVNDGRYGNDRSWISSEAGKGWVQIELPEAARIERVDWARDREGKFADRLATKYKIEVATENPEKAESWRVVASADDRRKFKAGAKPEPAYSFAGLSAAESDELLAALAERKSLDQKIAALLAAPKAYAGRFAQPGPTHLLYRGEAMKQREQVAPGALARVEPPLALPAESPERERRLALAKWIASPENPLTARVIINRLWRQHFGEGIVATPSDFGANGARPSHPELLDWLATELPARGWSLKALHRLIITSAAYRQSSAPREDALRVDAGNRLLWRFAPRRLEAEPIRDAILFASGKLDLGAGGPGYSPFEPNENYVRVYAPRKEFGPEQWRRMVFQTRVRMRLDGTFGAFDCPDGGQAAPRRTVSTTPLQALNLMNSEFMLQQAGFLAERIEKEIAQAPPGGTTGGGTIPETTVAAPPAIEKARAAFRIAFGREADADESAAATKLIASEGLAAFCRALLNANEFVYVD